MLLDIIKRILIFILVSMFIGWLLCDINVVKHIHGTMVFGMACSLFLTLFAVGLETHFIKPTFIQVHIIYGGG